MKPTQKRGRRSNPSSTEQERKREYKTPPTKIETKKRNEKYPVSLKKGAKGYDSEGNNNKKQEKREIDETLTAHNTVPLH